MPVVISDLLCTPEMQAIKENCGLVSDEDVCTLLLKTLLSPQYERGVVVDGFPRTPTQVEILKLVKNKLMDLYKTYMNGPGRRFQRPVFQVTVLWVEENESVERQLRRGQQALLHNREVERKGIGQKIAVRPSDFERQAATVRYKIFQQHYDTLLSLKKHFHFNIINASGSVDEVERDLKKEFTYQSKMELGPETFDLIHHLPTSEDIIRYNRQALVQRMDVYANSEKEIFTEVIKLTEEYFYPHINLNVLAGSCTVISSHTLLNEHRALQALVDLLSERGFHIAVHVEVKDDPVKVDAVTFKIVTEQKKQWVFNIAWKPVVLRN